MVNQPVLHPLKQLATSSGHMMRASFPAKSIADAGGYYLGFSGLRHIQGLLNKSSWSQGASHLRHDRSVLVESAWY